MILPDVNVLVYAFQASSPRHADYRRWFDDLINSEESYGVSELILSGFVRIVTHPRAFFPPAEIGAALSFADMLRLRPNAVPVSPGGRHWDIFSRLCREAGVKGSLVSDAYLAALAVENGAELVTADRDFARFPGLKWRHPLG